MKKKWFSLFLGAVFAIATLALNPFASSAEAAATKELKIGAIISMTGFASGAETLIWEGMQIFEDWINENGGITIKDQVYHVKMIAEDGQSSADGAVSAATKLIYDHNVKFIVGPVMPFMVASSGAVTEPAKVIRVALYNCFMPDEYSAKTPYTFIANDTTIDFISPNMEYLKEHYPGYNNITVLIPDDGSPSFIKPVVERKAKENGLRVKSVVKWSLATQDFTPIMVKALSSKPDSLLLVNGWPIHMGSMLKAAREMGFDGPVFAMHEDPYDIREVAGREASTEFYTHNVAMDAPQMTYYIKSIKKMGKEKFNRVSPSHVWGWSPTYILAQAIENAQSLDPTEVKNAWEKMKFIETAYGTGRMGGQRTYGINHNVSAPMPMVALQNGEVVWLGMQDVPMP